MPYVRISLMTPLPGRETEVYRMQEDLLAFYRGQPGFVEGYFLRDGSGRIGRMTVWESEEDDENMAQQAHVMAVRSEMRALVHAESDLDSFVEVGAEATKMA